MTHGNHGYDNLDDSMKGIFYASGPEFKRNFTLDRSANLYNVDLFNLMCFILRIDDCPSSNGTISNVEPFLLNSNAIKRFLQSSQRRTSELIFRFSLFALGLFVVFTICWTIVSLRSSLITRNRSKRSQII